jgi:hypothetical protein
MAEGGCNCGAVTFEADTEIDYLYACHCSLCRKWSGAQGVVVAVVPNAAFRWVKGGDLVRSWSHPDRDWHSAFCPKCGSALPGRNDETTLFIPAGTLTQGAEKARIADHIWVGSKASWDEIGGEGRQHDEAYKP